MDQIIENFINFDIGNNLDNESVSTITPEECHALYKFFNIPRNIYDDGEAYTYSELTLYNTQMDKETVDYMNHFLYRVYYPYCLVRTISGEVKFGYVNGENFSNIAIHTAIFNYLLHKKNNKLLGKICVYPYEGHTQFTVYCEGDNVRVENFMKRNVYEECRFDGETENFYTHNKFVVQ